MERTISKLLYFPFNLIIQLINFQKLKISIIIVCLKAPKLLAIVGNLTKAAFTHLFSLLASLNIFNSIGAIFISTFDIIFGNSLESLNALLIILFLIHLKI